MSVQDEIRSPSELKEIHDRTLKELAESENTKKLVISRGKPLGGNFRKDSCTKLFVLKSCYLLTKETNSGNEKYKCVDVLVVDDNSCNILGTDYINENGIKSYFKSFCMCEVDDADNIVKGGKVFILDDRYIVNTVDLLDEKRKNIDRIFNQLRNKLNSEEIEFIKKNPDALNNLNN